MAVNAAGRLLLQDFTGLAGGRNPFLIAGPRFYPFAGQPSICMMEILVGQVKGFLADPADAFRKVRGGSWEAALRYFVVLLVVYAVFSAIIAAVMGSMSPVSSGAPAGIPVPAAVFLFTLIGGLIGALVFGAWLHLWVALFGGKRGIVQTIRAGLYGSTPQLLFGWIPFIGFLFTLWSLYLIIVGLQELQDISMARAILAVFIAVMVPLILLILVASYLFIAYVTTSAVPAL